MKKVLCLVLAMMLGMTGIALAQSPSGDPIRIGLTTVLTGDRSLEGEYATNVVKIITEEINGAGGVLGRPIEIVIEDAQGNDVGAVTAWKKLAADDSIVAIIGTDSSNDNLAVADLAQKSQIMTTGQGSSPTLRDVCNANPWMFQLRACDVTLCEALINHAVNTLGYKTFALINETESSSSDQAKLFKGALAKYGITPSVEVSFATGTKDLTAQLVQIQQANVDAVIGAAFSDQAALLLQQMRAIGMEDMPVLGSNGFTDVVTLRLAGETAEGVMAATHWAPTTTSPKGAALSKKYTELYGEDCGKSAAQVYDHISVICEAIKRAGSTDRAAIRDAMNTITDYVGTMTTYDCSTNGDCGRGGIMVQIQNGVPVVLSEIISKK